jgi:hypothetical protein
MTMIKAIIINGVIVPRDPLPDDWHEGTEVAVELYPGDAAPAKTVVAQTCGWMKLKPSPGRAIHRMTNYWM